MIDLLVVGAGPAGLTSAIYSLRAGLSVTVIENNIYGGQMSITNTIENYPGIKSVSGPELSQLMYDQAESLGCKFVFEDISEVDLRSDIKSIKVLSGKVLKSRSVIIANGLKRRTLGCMGEKEFSGKGVSYCATCDGSFFRGKDVVVVGGGNTAVEDAFYLSNICKSVTIVVRKNIFRGESYLVDALKQKDNISVELESKVKQIRGGSIVDSVVLENTQGKVKELSVSGVFIAIGYEPNNNLYKGQLNLDDSGYFEVDETCATNIPGVYVAGDCRLKPLRQIVTASSDGAVASSQVIRHIASLKIHQNA